MTRYGTSELMRNKELQKKAIDYALNKLNPMIHNVGYEALNQLSTKIRPKKNYKTNRKDLDGPGVDIHAKGWTLPGHKYIGSYNDLENQVRYDPVTGEILEIYDQPTGKTDSIAMQHDVDYSVCKDDKKCKNKADRKMVKALDNVPYNERQWGHFLFYCASKYSNYNNYHIAYTLVHIYIQTYYDYTIDTVAHSSDMIKERLNYKFHLCINFFKLLFLVQIYFSVSYLILTLTIKLSMCGSTSVLLQLHK